MLSDLLEVLEGALQSTCDSGHATKSSTLKLLALEKRLGVFDKADIVASDLLDKMLRGGELAEGDAEVVGVVEGVHERAVEGVDVLETGEGLEDGAQFLGEGLLGELDLTKVEVCRQTISLGFECVKAEQSGYNQLLIRLMAKPARI